MVSINEKLHLVNKFIQYKGIWNPLALDVDEEHKESAKYYDWYYCEEELYLIREKMPNGYSYSFVKANSPNKAFDEYLKMLDEVEDENI